MRKTKKGELTSLALGVVTAIVMLFVGLYTFSMVTEIPEESVYKDYVYTTVTNSTALTVNTTQNGTHSLSIGALATIEGETPTKTITTTIENTDTSNITVNVYLNGASLGSVKAIAGANTTKTFSDVAWVANTVNNVTYEATYTGTKLKVLSTAGKYPSGKTDTSFGAINTNLTTKTKTIYDVLILVVIITALGVAIWVLKRFGGSGQATSVV